MTNNDFLRRLRYALNLRDGAMVEIFKLANVNVTKDDVINILKKDIEDDFKKINNSDLLSFLD